MLRRTNILLSRNRLPQVVALITLWWGCDALVRAMSLPVPGGVLGMAVLLLLLATGGIPSAWVRRGSAGLLDHMLLFFAPATMALLDHPELFSLTGLKILAVIVVGTLLVMVGTALAVEACFRWRGRNAD